MHNDRPHLIDPRPHGNLGSHFETGVSVIHEKFQVRLLRRVAMVLAMVTGVVAFGAAPAQAYSGLCSHFAGSDPTAQIKTCQTIYWSGSTIYHSTTLNVGVNATSATECKITGWLTLSSSVTGGQWNGPKQTSNCNSALRNWQIDHYYTFWSGPTSGVYAQGNICIDLYYNWSTQSGWQRCRETLVVSRY